PWYITQPDLADAVLFGEIEKLSRFFLIFYSHVRVELDLVMVDTNTKKYLYKNHVIATNRQFNLPSSIFGVGSSFVTSLWHMRGEQVKKSIEESAEAVAEKFQATVNDTVTESARIARVEIDLPKKTLREGEKVLIKVKTIPNRTLTFSLGNFDKDRPLVETAPGDYSGFHTVQPGENSNFIYVVVRMRDPAKPREELIFNIDDQAFAIDTIPPPDYELVRWGQTDGKPGIKLEFAPGPLGESRNEPPPVLYYLYRSAAPGKELRMIDKGEKPQFDDPGAQPGAEYDYAVIAEDAAGNRSAPKRGKVTVRGTETELPR
ncbi:hypothetical protein HY256_06920, partial [Candidatus Sumerlaeota bacterium]|nr:hypothetical protein [Candidatus Sumerlaeota bacterium]